MGVIGNPFQTVASLLYPELCVGCWSKVDRSEYLCASCQKRSPRIVPPYCAKCSEPFFGAITEEFRCANCENRVLYFEAAAAAYRSRGIVRQLIHDFKYGRQY